MNSSLPLNPPRSWRSPSSRMQCATMPGHRRRPTPYGPTAPTWQISRSGAPTATWPGCRQRRTRLRSTSPPWRKLAPERPPPAAPRGALPGPPARRPRALADAGTHRPQHHGGDPPPAGHRPGTEDAGPDSGAAPHGVAETYLQAVADEAVANHELFSVRLRRCHEIRPAGVTDVSHKRACVAIAGVERLVAESEGPPLVPEAGWAAWLMELAKTLGTPVDDELRNLLNDISETAPTHESLASYLNQMEPMAKDLALETSKLSIMTLTRSKGLTFRAAIIIGVEDGVIPSGRPEADEEEERRILYVGITRVRDYCFLTMAQRRTDATARASGGLPQRSRSRCRFLSTINLAPEDGDTYVRGLTQSRGREIR
jgi:hypothetical protein